MDRRTFVRASASAAGLGVLSCVQGTESGANGGAGSSGGAATPGADAVPANIRALRPMTTGVTPISDTERAARIEKARKLMVENNIDALYIEGGSSMYYFTGVRWGNSERMFAVVIPARGEIAFVCPAFEEQRARELIKPATTEVRVWEEDEPPALRVAQILTDRGIRAGRIGIEERVRFFLVDNIHRAAPQSQLVGAESVTAGCRMFKSPAEIALMQRANDITIEAYKAAFATLTEGMPREQFVRNLTAAFSALGVEGDGFVQFGKYTAFPHGSTAPQNLHDGDVVLVDGGCTVEGYKSDITRTTVFGKASDRQRKIWDLERRAQDAAFAAVKVGVACEDVDAAARKVITDAGFGPGYKVPGLPHRTGHGIGLDGHEWTNFVRGNMTPIAPGMCFSDEPTIVIYGEFGIRLEDCLYITEQGPKMFTTQSPAVDKPFA